MPVIEDRLLRTYPVFIRSRKAVVHFSPKAGCSHAVLWSFIHDGWFRAAERHDPWPHNYRLQVYHKKAAFKLQVRALLASEGAGYTLIRITRDPAARLVSIFRHACRFPFLGKPVRQVLGFDMRTRGLSLADLDAVLGSLNLVPPTDADAHVRTQYHPLWDLNFDRVITLNMDEVPLNQSLNAVERALRLPRTDFDQLPAFARLRDTHYAQPAAFASAEPIETFRISRDMAAHAFPKAEIGASPLVADMAARHYAIDLGRVGSGDTAGELFQRSAAGACARGAGALGLRRLRQAVACWRRPDEARAKAVSAAGADQRGEL